MSIVRILTDVPQSGVDFVVSTIRADNGTFELEPQPDGGVTVIATFPHTPAPPVVKPAAQTRPARWMEIAMGELGQAEIPGPRSNARIAQYHQSTDSVPSADSVHWCSSFVNFCIKGSGLPGTNSKMARSWLQWGRASDELVPGCVVVLSRGAAPSGHVGFYVGMEGGWLRLLGGNQANKVGIASFDPKRVLGCRIAP